MGYHHPSGEVHIMANGQWVSCPGKHSIPVLREGERLTGQTITVGQDNTSTECIVGDVPNIFDGDLSNHDGPYNGITMGSNCT